MKIAVYPGSFDPVTNGHLDIIKRASDIFDEVIVVVLVNPDKKGLFSIEERVQLIQKSCREIENVKVESFHGMLVNYMREKRAKVIIKGLRGVTDFEYEFQMALMNKNLDSSIETFFMMTNSKYSYISSSAIKQVAMFDGSIENLVPDIIVDDVVNKIIKK